MRIEELRLIDPQTPVTLRFGKLGDGEIEWSEDSWTKMRILVSDAGGRGAWFMNPISLDGRPYSLTLCGHNRALGTGRFISDDESYVMEIREMVEGDLLRECYDHSDRCGTLERIEDLGIPEEDMSPMAQLFVHVVREDDASVESLTLPPWVYTSMLERL